MVRFVCGRSACFFSLQVPLTDSCSCLFDINGLWAVDRASRWACLQFTRAHSARPSRYLRPDPPHKSLNRFKRVCTACS